MRGAGKAAPGKRSREWLLFALAALLFFGASNFILGFIAEKSAGTAAASIRAAMILWLGTGLDSIAAAVVLWLSVGACGVLAVSWYLFSQRHSPALGQASREMTSIAGTQFAFYFQIELKFK